MPEFSSESAQAAQFSPSTEYRITIGDVIIRLRDEFPDISISKIRFLETAGLVNPTRTSSGYRKFTLTDVERLRYVLRVQRDHFLPLKVIREHIDAMDRGLQPPVIGDVTPVVPSVIASTDSLEAHAVSTDIKLTAAELAANSGLTSEDITALEQYGLLHPRHGHYNGHDLRIATTCAELAQFGFEPRHLKSVASAASRELDLITPVVKSAKSRTQEGATAAAAEVGLQLIGLVGGLHQQLMRSFAERELR